MNLPRWTEQVGKDASILINSMTKILSSFFLDGTKIIFASLVAGVFTSQAYGSLAWLTLVMGIILTSTFLLIAGIIQKLGQRQ